MRKKVLGIGIATILAISSLVVARASSAVNNDEIDCNTQTLTGPVPTQVHNPFPTGVVVSPFGQILGPEDPCANLTRTLVFVGTARIDSGVNFAGMGDRSGNTNQTSTYDFPQGGSITNPGGSGICVMVNWNSLNNSAVAGGAPVTDCNFVESSGNTYGGPALQGTSGSTPIIRQALSNPAETGDGSGSALGTELDTLSGGTGKGAWDPAHQASCFNSDGSGAQTFIANQASQVGPPALQGGTETWSSVGNFSWDNSLDNLRGSISDDGGVTQFPFDAKMEAHADPKSAQKIGTGGSNKADVFDTSDAGCLQKNLVNLGLTQISNPNGTAENGLNYILVAGTATWDTRVPAVI